MAEEGIEEFMAREEEELDELPDNLKVTYRRLEIEYAALKVNLARKREEGKREEEKQRIAGVFAEFARPQEEASNVLYLPQQ